jgi:hypothetical protein
LGHARERRGQIDLLGALMRLVATMRAAAVFASLLLVSMLAACGGGDDSDASAPSPGATASAAVSSGSPDAQATTTGDSTPALPPGPTRTSSVDHRDAPFVYGWNVAWRVGGDGDEFNQLTIAAVQDSGFGWVRLQVAWSQFEPEPDGWDPAPVDAVVDAYSAAGINILIVVVKAPQWAIDPASRQMLTDWAEFEQLMRFLSDRYKGRVQAWEIWNEQNLASEVGGTVRPKDYLELLKAGSTGVRDGDPDALVLFGGLTPNGLNDPFVAYDDVQYLQLIYGLNDGEISQYFDILALQLNGTHNAPDWMFPESPGDEAGYNDHPSYYFRRGAQLRQVMLDHGDDAKPVWITNFGWTTANTAPGYEYGVNNTDEEVAQYLTRAFEIATAEWDFVTGAFVWNLNWSTLDDPDEAFTPWSAMNSDWSPRPAFDAMKALPKE